MDKADSISVESQLEFCKRELGSQSVKIYTDKGYSGKNLKRPAFRELIKDIEAGEIQRVVVYRLDRISRSVLDFAKLISFFQRYNVDFVSTMEKFDTSTPVGKAMLMIVMIFAQLERETIQQRIIDAYSSRSRRGFYMGGPVPYGFTLLETIIDGVRTKMYEINSKEAEVIRTIYSLYSEPESSLADVVSELKNRGIRKRDGREFGRGRIRELIINPIYVKADYDIYSFYKKHSCTVVDPPEHFIGVNGAYLYKGQEEKRKSNSPEGHVLVLAPHEGVIDSSLWLKCREKCMKSSGKSRPERLKHSWLTGKIVCAHCNHALTAKSYSRKTKADKRYFLCLKSRSDGRCDFTSLDADDVEKIIFEQIKIKLSDYEVLRKPAKSCISAELEKNIAKINDEINALIDKLPLANMQLVQYINNKVAQLDEKKLLLCEELRKSKSDNYCTSGEIKNYLELWDKLTTRDKFSVADSLIEEIKANSNAITIRWRI